MRTFNGSAQLDFNALSTAAMQNSIWKVQSFSLFLTAEQFRKKLHLQMFHFPQTIHAYMSRRVSSKQATILVFLDAQNLVQELVFPLKNSCQIWAVASEGEQEGLIQICPTVLLLASHSLFFWKSCFSFSGGDMLTPAHWCMLLLHTWDRIQRLCVGFPCVGLEQELGGCCQTGHKWAWGAPCWWLAGITLTKPATGGHLRPLKGIIRPKENEK